MVNVSFQTNSITVSGGTTVDVVNNTVGVSKTQTVNTLTQSASTSSLDVSKDVVNVGIGAAGSLSTLNDVDLTGKIDQSVLVYEAATGLFKANLQTVPSIADGGDF